MSASPNQAAGSKGNRNGVSSAMDILLDIALPVTLRFGHKQMSLNDVLGLNTGSIVEFDRAVEDPVEVLVNDRVVARGEAVTVQGHYAVRILEIGERLDSPPDVRLSPGPLAAIAGE